VLHGQNKEYKCKINLESRCIRLCFFPPVLQFTTGISLQFNGVTNEGLHVLCPALKPFVNLMALDLAANGIVLTPAETARPLLSELAAAFGALPRLQRLNLSGIRMRECVPAVLGAVGRPLSMLRLSGCGLRRSDLVWLASAAVSSQLEQLDIGANNLAPHVDAVCRILYHAGRTLTVFEAEDADLTPVAIGVLLSTFAELPQLRFEYTLLFHVSDLDFNFSTNMRN